MKKVGVLVLAAAMACVPAALARGKADTKVTLDNIEVTPGGTIWTGDIFSSDRACKNKRQVLVYLVQDGKDEKIGSTRSYKGMSQPGYYWSLEKDGIPDPGNYYAKAPATADCQADKSDTMSPAI
jgi:hypothetical protein